MEKNTTKGYSLNLTAKTLTITKAFEEAVAKGNTPEYRIYKKLMRDIPGLTVERRTHKTPSQYRTRTGEVVKGHNKNKGLTYDRMERFISALSNSEELMEQYDFIKAYALNPYSAVVGWFEAQFPKFRKNPLYYLSNSVEVIDGNKFLTLLESVA